MYLERHIHLHHLLKKDTVLHSPVIVFNIPSGTFYEAVSTFPVPHRTHLPHTGTDPSEIPALFLKCGSESYPSSGNRNGSFKGESSFSSWLYRIAKNAALDYLRREKKNRTVSLDAENEDGEKYIADIPDSSGKNDPEKATLDAEKRTLLYAALEELSDEHKEILLLRDINGYTYEEVGDRLGLEPGTVKSRLFRAREALRKKLEEKNYF